MAKIIKTKKIESFSRLVLVLIVILNAIVPTVALAKPNLEENISEHLTTTRSLPIQFPVYYEPQPLSSKIIQTDQEDEEPLVPKKDTVEFTISTEKAKVEGDRTVTIHVFIRNHSKNTIENLSYYDTLDSNYLYQQSSDSLVTFNTLTQTVN